MTSFNPPLLFHGPAILRQVSIQVNTASRLIITVTKTDMLASKRGYQKKGGDLRPPSVREYAEAMRSRYERAEKREKGMLLTEFCSVTGYHRKAAIRLLRRPSAVRRPQVGRPRQYGPEVRDVLRTVWEASDAICSKRLAPFMGEFVAALERIGALDLEPVVREPLLRLSAATIDRLLRPFRRTQRRHLFTQSAASAALKGLVPVRTFGEWQGVSPGSFQADLVVHSGESSGGFFLTTLVVVDVRTGWTDFEAVWGKGQNRVAAALHEIRCRLPMPMRELHTDNGGEFLNHVLYPYCQREGIRLTRGRPYKKNDQAFVEQKNGAVIRQHVGYQRFISKPAFAALQDVYRPLRLSVNFFQPVQKLIHTERLGARVRKAYDRAQTPYRRLIASEPLAPAEQDKLERFYLLLNPLALKAKTEHALHRLWDNADPLRPEYAPPPSRSLPLEPLGNTPSEAVPAFR